MSPEIFHLEVPKCEYEHDYRQQNFDQKEPDFCILHNCTIFHCTSHFYFFPLMPTSILPIAHVAKNKPKMVAKITNGFLRPARRG